MYKTCAVYVTITITNTQHSTPNTTGALQLGKNFSLWPEPAEGGVLNTTGVYALCRHPMYAGLVAFSLGLGFSTDSFTRIALACLLGYVLVRVQLR